MAKQGGSLKNEQMLIWTKLESRFVSHPDQRSMKGMITAFEGGELNIRAFTRDYTVDGIGFYICANLQCFGQRWVCFNDQMSTACDMADSEFKG